MTTVFDLGKFRTNKRRVEDGAVSRAEEDAEATQAIQNGVGAFPGPMARKVARSEECRNHVRFSYHDFS